MAKPLKSVTPEGRVERWKKLWGASRMLDDAATEEAFEEFQTNFVPSHMRKKFLQFFGMPKAQFGNRFFRDDAAFTNWDAPLSRLGVATSHVEVTVIYGSPDSLEAHAFRGESRRTLRDIVVDDWHAACAIAIAGDLTLYIFIEPKMRGCIVLPVGG
jgi:hypothetical protein